MAAADIQTSRPATDLVLEDTGHQQMLLTEGMKSMSFGFSGINAGKCKSGQGRNEQDGR